MRGVLVGSDARQEWLLPWWWENYCRYNSYPVTFADFGLSREMKKWCGEVGAIMPIHAPPCFVKDRSEVERALTEKWEEKYNDTFWEAREAWFKKPFACLQSPYLNTIWVDADCEVVASLEDLFAVEFGLVRDQAAEAPDFPIYNSGVIAFKKDHPLIVKWAAESLKKNGLFRGDQDLLSSIIHEKKIPIKELDPIYNWSIGEGKNSEAAVYHWLGEAAKDLLRKGLILKDLQSGLIEL